MSFKDDIIAIIDYIDKQDTDSSCIHGAGRILVLQKKTSKETYQKLDSPPSF